MKRDSIDQAGLAQFDRMMRLLRDVNRSGGKDRWSHLFSHGHKFPTIRSAVSQGYLLEPNAYHYEITDAAHRMLSDVETEQMRRI